MHNHTLLDRGSLRDPEVQLPTLLARNSSTLAMSTTRSVPVLGTILIGAWRSMD